MSSRRGPIKGNSFMSVEVQGIPAIHRALMPLLEPEITNLLDEANKKGAQMYAKALRPPLRAVSKHMAKAVRVKRARTGRPGWVIGSKRKVAFFWPFVIGGTKDHGPRKAEALLFVPGWNPYLGASSKGVGNKVVRAKSVRGVKANPIVERVAKANEKRIADAISIDFGKQAGL